MQAARSPRPNASHPIVYVKSCETVAPNRNMIVGPVAKKSAISMFNTRNNRITAPAASHCDGTGSLLWSLLADGASHQAASRNDAAHTRYAYRYQLKMRSGPRGS